MPQVMRRPDAPPDGNEPRTALECSPTPTASFRGRTSSKSQRASSTRSRSGTDQRAGVTTNVSTARQPSSASVRSAGSESRTSLDAAQRVFPKAVELSKRPHVDGKKKSHRDSAGRSPSSRRTQSPRPGETLPPNFQCLAFAGARYEETASLPIIPARLRETTVVFDETQTVQEFQVNGLHRVFNKRFDRACPNPWRRYGALEKIHQLGGWAFTPEPITSNRKDKRFYLVRPGTPIAHPPKQAPISFRGNKLMSACEFFVRQNSTMEDCATEVGLCMQEAMLIKTGTTAASAESPLSSESSSCSTSSDSDGSPGGEDKPFPLSRMFARFSFGAPANRSHQSRSQSAAPKKQHSSKHRRSHSKDRKH